MTAPVGLWTVRPMTRPEEIPTDEVVSPFQAPWTNTVELLTRELRFLRAERTVLELEVVEQQIRADGQLKGRMVPFGPRVRLSFESRYGPLRYACGRFGDDTIDLGWKWNVRAIGLGLEALRKVDRYGITKRGEQYTGWRQLTAGSSAPGMSVEAAARWIVDALNAGDDPEQLVKDVDEYRGAYRRAARLLHPDTGGDTKRWSQLQEARQLLDQHHRLSR